MVMGSNKPQTFMGGFELKMQTGCSIRDQEVTPASARVPFLGCTAARPGADVRSIGRRGVGVIEAIVNEYREKRKGE